MDTLPFVLLGILTTLKEDTSSTAAEMVYGTTLRLPGKFFTPSQTSSLPDPSDYVANLRTHMQTIRPPPPCPTQRNSNIIDGLSTATHVFIRHDAVRKPLQPRYDGPYRVIKRTENTLQSTSMVVTILSPSIASNPLISIPTTSNPTSQTTPPTTQPCRSTRSGQCVHFPQYLSQRVS